MANLFEPTSEQREAWEAWVAERPPTIREVIERHALEPWKLYRLTSSGHRVYIHSVDEPKDGSAPTLKVIVSGDYNAVAFERTVFGIQPEDLVECELPSPDELVGSAGLTPEEAIAAAEALGLRKPGAGAT
jgi:hypothetical protein